MLAITLDRQAGPDDGALGIEVEVELNGGDQPVGRSVVLAANGGWKLLAALPGAAVLGFTLWTGWYALTRRCYWVSVNADGSCEFRALARRTRLTAAEILRIERSSAGNFWHSGEGPPSHPDNTKVVHRDGSVIIVQPLAGFERLQALIDPVADQAE